MNVKAIILTAGEGAHFYPLTVTRPKGMSIVAGKPLLQHTVEALVACGVKECWFVVGYKPERLRAFFGNGANFGIEAHYVTQEKPNGIGNALRLAAATMKPSEETIVVFGDNHYTIDVVRQVMAAKGDAVLGTTEADPRRTGLLVAKAGKLQRVEHPATSDKGLVNAGLMKFTPKFFSFLQALKEPRGTQLVHALQAFIESGGSVEVPVVERGWDAAEDVWELLRMNERLLDEASSGPAPKLEGVRIEGAVLIAPSAKVKPGAQILGPVYIGADCEIRENAIVGPYVSMRNNVHVGSGSEVRHAIINNYVFIDSQCVVRFSILDDGVRLGPFCSVAEGTPEATNGDLPMRRGAVIGPDAVLGARVTVKPGSILGEESKVDDGAVIGSHRRVKVP